MSMGTFLQFLECHVG